MCLCSVNLLWITYTWKRKKKKNKDRKKYLNIKQPRRKSKPQQTPAAEMQFVATQDSARKVVSKILCPSTKQKDGSDRGLLCGVVILSVLCFSLWWGRKGIHEVPNSFFREIVVKTMTELVWDLCSLLATTWPAKEAKLAQGGKPSASGRRGRAGSCPCEEQEQPATEVRRRDNETKGPSTHLALVPGPRLARRRVRLSHT